MTPHREAEKALRAQELSYRELFDASGDAIFVHDAATGALLDVNQTMLDMFGFTREEALRLDADDSSQGAPPYSRADAMRWLQAAVKDGPQMFEWRSRRKNGELFWTEVTLRCHQLGGRACVLANARDITGRKRAEESLRRTNDLLQSIFEASPLAIITLDLDLNVTLWSPAAEQMFGWTSEEVLGRRYPIAPDSVWSEVEATRDQIKEGSGSVQEGVRRHKDGSLVHIGLSAAPMRDADGEVIGGVAIFSDITERKRSEEELRFTNAILRTQHETSPDGILVVDDNGKIVSWNQRFAEMWGLSTDLLEQGLDAPVLEWVTRHVVDSAAFLSKVKYAYDHRDEKFHDELVLTNGSTFERDSAPMHAPDGRYYGRVWHFRDITPRKRAEEERAELQEQLHQSQKMEAVGLLAGGVAHDFNNLLTVILGNIEIMERALPGNKMLEEAAGMMRTATEQAIGVTRSLLTFSRRMPTDKQATCLQQVVANATRMLRRLLPASIDVVAKPAQALALWVNADANQLHQVLLNLAINARDAMPEGGTLTIAISQEMRRPLGDADADAYLREFACLSVSDTGSGIPEAARAHLFEPFFTTKPRGHGTGLGLPIVHGIVENHGGMIEVESEEGKGAHFRILLPCIKVEPDPSQAAPTQAAPRGEGESILVAEDNRFVRGTLVSVLQELGYAVTTAVDGPALLESWNAHREHLQLLIVDIDLPGRRGTDCVRIIREQGPSVPVVLITGAPEHGLEDALDERTFLLRKPFSVTEIGLLVSRLLRSDLPSEGLS